jgi:hypothetical protein
VPLETIMVLLGIVAMFAIFGIAIGWAARQAPAVPLLAAGPAEASLPGPQVLPEEAARLAA